MISNIVLWILYIGAIAAISFAIARISKKFWKQNRFQPFIAVSLFAVLTALPFVTAQSVQLYLCYANGPLITINKPLGEAFKGYYRQFPGKVRDFRDLVSRNPGLLEYIDTQEMDPLTSMNRYVRYYFDERGSANCIFPDERFFQNRKERMEKGEKVRPLDPIFSKEQKCVARKAIAESALSPYQHVGPTQPPHALFSIPFLLEVKKEQYPLFIDRETGEVYTEITGYRIEWSFYGLGFGTSKFLLECNRHVDLKELLIRTSKKALIP